MNFIERYFGRQNSKIDIGNEFIGGLTSFLTMAYIIFVNPSILGDAGMDKSALITATCLAAFFGTVLIGVWARVPYAMAPGMGLNAFFTYTLVLGQGLTWQTALGVVFVSGVLFLILTVVGIRERIVNAIPVGLRISAAAGIGVFITFIGMKNLGLIVASKPTLVAMGPLTRPVLLGLVGLVVIAVLEVKKVRGAILLGIMATFALGVFFGEVKMVDSFVSAPPSLTPLLFQLDITGALKWGFAGAIFSFMFVDFFDSIGTIVACSYESGHIEPDGTIRDIDKMLEADALATIFGTLIGTSTTTTYIESASGIADGARTGLASIFTGCFFLLALFFAPVIGAVPAFATAPALIVVGVFMFKSIKDIDFTDFRIGLPAFLTIVVMPLSFSIATGLTVGFLSYVVISALSGNARNISRGMWGIGFLSLINLLITSGG